MRNRFIFSFLFLTSIIFISCNTSKMTFDNSKLWIPEDFNPKTSTLLVQIFSGSKKIQKQMENYLSQTYPFKYEFAPIEMIKNKTGKYADSKLYIYALVFTTHTTHYRYIADNSPSRLVTNGTDFNFFDRQLSKDYPKTGKFSSYPMMTFKPVINTIVKRFE